MNKLHKTVDLSHALISFREELGQLDVPQSERVKYLNQFKRYFENSWDYDLTVARVFDEIMNRTSRRKKSAFKNYWKNNISKDNLEAQEVAQQIYEEEKAKGTDWKRIFSKIVKALVVGLGILFVEAIVIANRIGKK